MANSRTGIAELDVRIGHHMTETNSKPKPELPAIAWIASGKLHVKQPGQEIESIESTFARETIERRIRAEQHDGWKGRSGVWGNMGMAPPDMSQWNDGIPRQEVRFCGLASGDDATQLYYVLDLGGVGGLFKYDLAKGYESRLMHREGFTTPDLSRHSKTGEVAITMGRDGLRAIAIGENDGRLLKNVTVSDGLDEVPAWVDDGSQRIVYQSLAYQRDDQGYHQGISTYRIEMLDLEKEDISTVHEEEGFDLLQPRMQADGTLYFVRRPYKSGPPPRAFIEDVKDIFMFPFRLLGAIFHFLNFFSTMFSGKPLTTGLGQREQSPNETRRLMLWGHMIDTRRAMARAAKEGKAARLVPSDWELIRRDTAGNETVLADHVMCYDVNAAGDVLYTDGSRIMFRRDDKTETIVTDAFVEKLAIL